MGFKQKMTESTPLLDSLVSIVEEYYAEEYGHIRCCYSFYRLYTQHDTETRDAAFTELLTKHLDIVVPTYSHTEALVEHTYGEVGLVTVKNVAEQLQINFSVSLHDGRVEYIITMDSNHGEFTEIRSTTDSQDNHLKNKTFISFNTASIDDWTGKEDSSVSYENIVKKALSEEGLLTFLRNILSNKGAAFKPEEIPAVTVTNVPEIIEIKPTTQEIEDSLSKVSRQLKYNVTQFTMEQCLQLFSSCYSVYTEAKSTRPHLKYEIEHSAREQFMADKGIDSEYSHFREGNNSLSATGFKSDDSQIYITLTENEVQIFFQTEDQNTRLTFKDGVLESQAFSLKYNLASLKSVELGLKTGSSFTLSFLRSLLYVLGDALIIRSNVLSSQLLPSPNKLPVQTNFPPVESKANNNVSPPSLSSPVVSIKPNVNDASTLPSFSSVAKSKKNTPPSSNICFQILCGISSTLGAVGLVLGLLITFGALNIATAGAATGVALAIGGGIAFFGGGVGFAVNRCKRSDDSSDAQNPEFKAGS